MRIRFLIVVVGLFLGLLVLAPTVGLTQDGVVNLSAPEVQRMTDLVAACGDLAQNTICYGGGTVEIGMTEGRQVPVENVGDRLPLTEVERIQTRIGEDCAWGGVVMNVQGSQPLSQPGITFIALGNVTIENAAAPETLFQSVEPLTIDLPSRVNIRTQPSRDADILTTTRSSTSLPADALSADGAWVRVLMDEEIAWVFRELIASASDLNALPTLIGDARGRMQAFTVRTEATSCASQMPSLLLIQTPEGVPTPLTINGSEFTVGSTIVLTRFSGVAGAPPEPILTAGEGAPPDDQVTAGEGSPPEPDYESLLVIEGSVAALLADGSVMPIAEGCAFQTLMGDGSVLPQGDRLVLGNPSLVCGSDSSLTGSDGGLGSLTGSDGGLDSFLTGSDGGVLDKLGLLPLLNDLLLIDIGGQGISAVGYIVEWTEINNSENSDFCAGFEGVSPLSGSILLAPSPQSTSQLTQSQLTFTFPLLTTNLAVLGADSMSQQLNSFDASFNLATGSEVKISRYFDQNYIAGHFVTQGTSFKSVTFTYNDLIESNLIAEGQTDGTIVWWAAFNFVNKDFNLVYQCVTDLYVLSWSNSLGERSSQTMSTAAFNLPTAANTPGATDHPLTILGASTTPPFTIATQTNVPPTRAPLPTSIPPTAVPPTRAPLPTSIPPTAVHPTRELLPTSIPPTAVPPTRAPLPTDNPRL